VCVGGGGGLAGSGLASFLLKVSYFIKKRGQENFV
jgi:hypothetical protein